MKLAFPKALLGRDTADGMAMVRPVLSLTTDGGWTGSGAEYSRVSDVRFPPGYIRLFDGPSSIGLDMWR
eukprot:14621082-Alexandrium_andersonii.AAC.1